MRKIVKKATDHV